MSGRVRDMKSESGMSFLAAAAALSAMVLLPASAAASGGGHHEPALTDLFWFWVNFVLYLGLLFVLLRRKAPAFWADRREQIEQGVAEGRDLLANARQNVEQAEERLNSVAADIQKLIRKIEADTQREAAEIVAEANKRAELAAARTQSAIDIERKGAERRVRGELADLVIRRAESGLRERLSADSDRGIRDAALEGIRSLIG